MNLRTSLELEKLWEKHDILLDLMEREGGDRRAWLDRITCKIRKDIIMAENMHEECKDEEDIQHVIDRVQKIIDTIL